ncbi:MAG TPA: hypothetical protein PLO37_20020 [Candidatus Hydrogenedentes bacterium]|nr:hypothetical protein [Candidatus Hydrogenedentota bacterium]HPG69143.1 hypothetical protein [Candidatus Hydrogenedentota bacterium]
MKRAGWLIVAALMGPILVSCATKKTPEEIEGERIAAEFRPGTPIAPLRFDRGHYPDLLAPTSFAVWVDEAVTEARRAAAAEQEDPVTPQMNTDLARVARDFVCIECYLDSAFADMSIAYDVVGCRGVSMYLSTPEDNKIAPVQVAIGTELKEEPRDALKLFGRKSLLVFPRRDLWLSTPLLDEGAPAMRLVVEGYDSAFYFEWAAAGPTEPVRVPAEPDVAKMLRTGLREFYNDVRRISHVFD